MHILVTGGAGFIGSHLCEKLINNGNEVYCVDNFITGDKKNIEFLLEDKRFHLIKHDVCSLGNDQIKKIKKIDQIYHLASPASPIDYAEIPLETLWTNAVGTKNMLELAKRHNANFLFASTSEVYGDPLEHPQKENYFGNVNPIGKRSCYNESKRFAESLIVNFSKKADFPFAIIRIFNTYGPRMRKDDGRVIPEFINNALNNRFLKISGIGKQTRSFCYIDEMVEGLVSAMKKIREGVNLGPINLGNPQEISIIELANKIKDLTGSKSDIEFIQLPEDDPMKRCPDISLAKDLLGFDPKISLDEGLQKTIEYFKGVKRFQ